MEYPRSLPVQRQPRERILDWAEFPCASLREDLRQQGALHGLCGAVPVTLAS